ncbi:MAG: hypothetical protein V2A73_07495 [Pseudomonadota bacterium]
MRGLAAKAMPILVLLAIARPAQADLYEPYFCLGGACSLGLLLEHELGIAEVEVILNKKNQKPPRVIRWIVEPRYGFKAEPSLSWFGMCLPTRAWLVKLQRYAKLDGAPAVVQIWKRALKEGQYRALVFLGPARENAELVPMCNWEQLRWAFNMEHDPDYQKRRQRIEAALSRVELCEPQEPEDIEPEMPRMRGIAMGDCMDGKKEGHWVSVDKDTGAVVDEGDFRQGRRVGRWREYLQRSREYFEGEYVDGKRVGEWKYYDASQRLHSLEHYVDGRLHGQITYWDENGILYGTCAFAHGWRHGECVKYHRPGVLASKETRQYGNREGLVTEWYENGQKKKETTYRFGFPDGPRTQWDRDGRVTFYKVELPPPKR